MTARDKLLRAQQLLADATDAVHTKQQLVDLLKMDARASGDLLVSVVKRRLIASNERGDLLDKILDALGTKGAWSGLPDAVTKLQDKLTQHKQLLETVKAERDRAHQLAVDRERQVFDIKANNPTTNAILDALEAAGHGEGDGLVGCVNDLAAERDSYLTEINRATSLRQQLMTALGDGVLDDDALVDRVKELVATATPEPKYRTGGTVLYDDQPYTVTDYKYCEATHYYKLDTMARWIAEEFLSAAPVAPVAKYKYAVGDTIVAGSAQGEVTERRQLTDGRNQYRYRYDGHVWEWTDEADLDPWTAPTPPKFKVGDWVRLRSRGVAYRILEYRWIDNEVPQYRFMGPCEVDYWYGEDNLVPAEFKFEVGGLVIVNGQPGAHRITERAYNGINARYPQYRTDEPERHYWWNDEHNLTAATTEPEFKVGDLVTWDNHDGVHRVSDINKCGSVAMQDSHGAYYSPEYLTRYTGDAKFAIGDTVRIPDDPAFASRLIIRSTSRAHTGYRYYQFMGDGASIAQSRLELVDKGD